MNIKEYKQKNQVFSKLYYLQNVSEIRNVSIICLSYIILAWTTFYGGISKSNVHQTEESFDCILNACAITLALFCSIKAKDIRTDESYPFGLERLEYLSAFTISIHIVLMSIIHFSRNVHEIFEDYEVFQNLIKMHEGEGSHSISHLLYRIIISFIGVFLLIEYIRPIDRDINNESYAEFQENYKLARPISYYNHYINMHSLACMFFAELLLNVGSFLEYMLDNVIQFSGIGTLIVIFAIIIIIQQLRPLIKTTIYSLLLATDDQFEETRELLEKVDESYNMFILTQGNQYNAMIGVKDKAEEVQEQLKDRFSKLIVYIQ